MASIRHLLGRTASAMGAASALGIAIASTSCGGGGGSFAAKPMVLTEFLFVDRALQPSFPTGSQALPRNAQIIFQFSELVDPSSVNQQTIAFRFGPQFSSVPKGSYQIDGSRVIFDPTVTAQGTPNPFGFESVTQYDVELPAAGQANAVVENLDNDPLTTSFLSNFTTSDGYLRELVPPELLSLSFIPGQDPLTKSVPGNSILALRFSEPMDPASFVLATGISATTSDTIDIRYTNDVPPPPTTNSSNGLSGVAIIGSFTHDPAASTYFFAPTFSWGNKKYTFTVQVFQGITDLSGNLLINPQLSKVFTCDGNGIATGKLLSESFNNVPVATSDQDFSKTSADWGFTVPGTLEGAAISSNTAYIAGYQFADAHQGGYGQYNPIADPLTGAQLNLYVTNINPPTSAGRRVMWSFSDVEIGQNGSVTTVGWGPDSNATFAAQYPDIVLRIGFQKTASLSLSESFSGNYLGTPLIMYKGVYSVKQFANVDNATVLQLPDRQPSDPSPLWGSPVPAQLQPLYIHPAGYYPWPAPTSFFDWDEGDATVDGDSVLIFDASVEEGDTFQQVRGWFGVTNPGSGVLISGFPTRRMYATYEENVPNPPSNFVAGIVNPEPSVTDTAFTLTKRVSVAQSKFYTPPATDPAGNSYPVPYSTQTTFGVKTNYLDAILAPAVQGGGTTLLVEYQGAIALDPASSRTKVNTTFPSTAFTTNVNDCDGFPYICWRLTLVSNLISNKVAKLGSISIPMLQLP